MKDKLTNIHIKYTNKSNHESPYSISESGNLNNKYYEKNMSKILFSIQSLKKDQSKKLSKYFSNLSSETRKLLLPKVVAALFGESSYEIDIIKHGQIYNN